ncbi:MAG: hypothetical protein P4L67_04345 [Candidatus Pacebacteria bacterium]|nr:hypothetical protein [Candidatus Paceibacterota bacterium]
MTMATEDRINLIRNRLVEASLDLTEFQANNYGGAPGLDAVQNNIEDVIVEFERVVDALTMEAE